MHIKVNNGIKSNHLEFYRVEIVIGLYPSPKPHFFTVMSQLCGTIYKILRTAKSIMATSRNSNGLAIWHGFTDITHSKVARPSFARCTPIFELIWAIGDIDWLNGINFRGIGLCGKLLSGSRWRENLPIVKKIKVIEATDRSNVNSIKL